jgi:hypothetical protein
LAVVAESPPLEYPLSRKKGRQCWFFKLKELRDVTWELVEGFVNKLKDPKLVLFTDKNPA